MNAASKKAMETYEWMAKQPLTPRNYKSLLGEVRLDKSFDKDALAAAEKTLEAWKADSIGDFTGFEELAEICAENLERGGLTGFSADTAHRLMLMGIGSRRFFDKDPINFKKSLEIVGRSIKPTATLNNITTAYEFISTLYSKNTFVDLYELAEPAGLSGPDVIKMGSALSSHHFVNQHKGLFSLALMTSWQAGRPDEALKKAYADCSNFANHVGRNGYDPKRVTAVINGALADPKTAQDLDMTMARFFEGVKRTLRQPALAPLEEAKSPNRFATLDDRAEAFLEGLKYAGMISPEVTLRK